MRPGPWSPFDRLFKFLTPDQVVRVLRALPPGRWS